MKEIELTKGKFALVDDCDFDRVSAFKWQAAADGNTYYAQMVVDGHSIRMHRFILGVRRGVGIDHKNRNGLDNRRENIRVATQSQNNHNRPAQKRPWKKHSEYKGLTWAYGPSCWQVRIMVDGRRRLIGYFKDEAEAARAYNAAAREMCGEYALLNVVAP